MMKRDELAGLVKQNKSKEIQINHFMKTKTCSTHLGNNEFVAEIESSLNPSKAYARQMNQMYRDQLSQGLQERIASKIKTNVERDQGKNHYQERLDGVLCELQKNSVMQSSMLEARVKRQEERGKKFIDENKLKTEKLSLHASRNNSETGLNFEGYRYQQYQKNQYQKTRGILKIQREEKEQKKIFEIKAKEGEFHQRLIRESEIAQRLSQEKQQRIKSKSQYKNELQQMVEEKQLRNSHVKVEENSRVKHNPITNPIEYHVENPYLLKKMQEKRLILKLS